MGFPIHGDIRGIDCGAGGWDLNPRTPARLGPKPCSFDQTWIRLEWVGLGHILLMQIFTITATKIASFTQ